MANVQNIWCNKIDQDTTEELSFKYFVTLFFIKVSYILKMPVTRFQVMNELAMNGFTHINIENNLKKLLDLW